MTAATFLLPTTTLVPAVAMLCAVPLCARHPDAPANWGRFRLLMIAATAVAAINLMLQIADGTETPASTLPGLTFTMAAACLALLVQWLALVIGVFSERYLQGEHGQPRYVAALASTLGAVQLMLLADHWLVLIAAWAAVSMALQPLLCFYDNRPFALLAAHKKRVVDRLADILLFTAAALAWHDAGSGALPELWRRLHDAPASMALQVSAVLLALAVVLRSALLPAHGWLIQVMEAPTPVSALLHAGAVNLGGFVLIRFAPLLQAAHAARWMLVTLGLGTAVLAGLVMLTRVSIKVRLAWSTVAQMGFMLMECGIGLYTLALLHLVGHSLYKAHAFLAASGAVAATRRLALRGPSAVSVASVLAAPFACALLIAAVVKLHAMLTLATAWPWWWTGVLALAWAPLLWHAPARADAAWTSAREALAGLAMVTALVLATLLCHALPSGLRDEPDDLAGVIALCGLATLHGCLGLMQFRPAALSAARRWSYAGFYIDEWVTRATLRVWPTPWMPTTTR